MRQVEKISFDRVDEIIRHLDLFSRILIGQYNEISYYVTGRFFSVSDDRELSFLWRRLRDKLIPAIRGYDMNGSLGIWSQETPLIAMRAYDIQQCLRYQISYHRYPEGGYTVNFNVPYIHGQWDVDAEHLQEYHDILIGQNCGVYRKGYTVLHPWTCPVILDSFEKDTVALTIDDSAVYDIIRLADRWYDYVIHADLYALFKEVADYSTGEIDDESLHDLCDAIADKIKR